MYTYKMEIGDWSHDGHNQSEVFVLETSHKNTEIQKAYSKACVIGDISLHGHSKNAVLSEYEDSGLDSISCAKLIKLGVDLENLETLETSYDSKIDDGLPCTPQDCVTLFMEMAKTQLSDLKYKIVSDEIPEIQAPGHAQIGYGCFY